MNSIDFEAGPNLIPPPASTPTAAGHNNPPKVLDEAGAFKLYARLGEGAGKGALKGAEFLERVAECTRLGLHGQVNAEKGKELWSRFRTAQLKAMGNMVMDSGKEANAKQRASNVTTVMFAAAKAGVNLNELFAEVRRILPDMKANNETKHNTWDAFVAVASAQKSADEQLDDGEVRKALLPKEADNSKEYNELIALEAVKKTLTALIEGKKATDKSPGKPSFASEQAQKALAEIEDRISRVTLVRTAGKSKAKH